MRIKDVMTPTVWTVRPEQTLRQCARLMKTRGVGVVPVCRARRVLGIVTDRDLVVRGLAGRLDPDTATVAAVMSRDPAWCRAEEDVEAAAQVMESRRVRRLPVLDEGGHIVGLISIDDIARLSEERELAGDVLQETAAPPAGRGRSVA